MCSQLKKNTKNFCATPQVVNGAPYVSKLYASSGVHGKMGTGKKGTEKRAQEKWAQEKRAQVKN